MMHGLRIARITRYVGLLVAFILLVYVLYHTHIQDILMLKAVCPPQKAVPPSAPLDANAQTEQLSAQYERENATFVTLARNQDLWSLVGSIREVEDRFNHKYHYDWVFLNNDEFTDEFIEVTSHFVSGNAAYGKIPEDQWGYPEWIDQDKASGAREQMSKDQIKYGDSESYRHMCRYESGFFWRNEILDNYKYYWRVEPNIRLLCDVEQDLFKFMRENGKVYGFVVSLHEYEATIKTLWPTVKDFMKKFPDYLHPNNALGFISGDEGETYNLCHFWSNFEIGDMDFWRSEAYQAFFDHLDKSGGFFYERWGDAPVHSIALALLADRNQIHFFDDVGYWHPPIQTCPVNKSDRSRLRCTCPLDDRIVPEQRNVFTFHDYSCTPRWYRTLGKSPPAG